MRMLKHSTSLKWKSSVHQLQFTHCFSILLFLKKAIHIHSNNIFMTDHVRSTREGNVFRHGGRVILSRSCLGRGQGFTPWVTWPGWGGPREGRRVRPWAPPLFPGQGEVSSVLPCNVHKRLSSYPDMFESHFFCHFLMVVALIQVHRSLKQLAEISIKFIIFAVSKFTTYLIVNKHTVTETIRTLYPVIEVYQM